MGGCSNELGKIFGVQEQGQPEAALLLVGPLNYQVLWGKVLYLFSPFFTPILG